MNECLNYTSVMLDENKMGHRVKKKFKILLINFLKQVVK